MTTPTQADAMAALQIVADNTAHKHLLSEAIETIRAALTQKPPVIEGIPAGWKLVPIEPTEGFPSMAQAGAAELWDQCKDGLIGHPQAIAVYKAMLSAAPTPPQESVDLEALKADVWKLNCEKYHNVQGDVRATTIVEVIDHLAATHNISKKS